MTSLPLCCFAPISWYVLYAEEEFALSNEEYFQKQTYRNRFDILTGNGVQTLTIPVESTGGERKLLRDIRISSEYNGKKMLQAIRSAYGNSAMYDFIDVELEALFLKEEKFLIDFNMKAHEWSMKWFPKIPEGRLIESKIPEERLAEPKILDERLIESKIPEERLAEPKILDERLAEPKILDERWKVRGTRPVELKSYPQVFADRFPFEQDLSILDAIFNLGKTSTKSLGRVNNS
ncbi:MAG: hypothetical protein RLZZ155_677 [Bacteroidota bacterium]